MSLASAADFGAHVFRVELPLQLAPTMNVYAQLQGWRKAKMATQIDWYIVAAKLVCKTWAMGVVREPKGKTGRPGSATGGRRRAIIVTRYSSVRPDELAVDSIGGKLVVDRLVHANVLRNDDPDWCERRAAWEKAPPGKGSLVVNVYEAV